MPKLAEAIITGTMARPSRPSVRFTALPAPTMMKAPKMTKNQPKLITASLMNGIASELDNGSRPSRTSAKQAAAAIRASISNRVRPAKPACVCFVTLR